VNTCFNLSDGENGILDIHNDIPTTSLCKQLPLSAVDFISDSETSTVVEESSEPESSDDKTSDMGCKTDKKPSNEPFLETTGLNIVIDNHESVVDVMSSISGDELIQLLLNSLTSTIVKMHKNGKSSL